MFPAPKAAAGAAWSSKSATMARQGPKADRPVPLLISIDTDFRYWKAAAVADVDRGLLLDVDDMKILEQQRSLLCH